MLFACQRPSLTPTRSSDALPRRQLAAESTPSRAGLAGEPKALALQALLQFCLTYASQEQHSDEAQSDCTHVLDLLK